MRRGRSLAAAKALLRSRKVPGNTRKNPLFDPERSRSGAYSGPFMDFFDNCSIFCAAGHYILASNA